MHNVAVQRVLGTDKLVDNCAGKSSEMQCYLRPALGTAFYDKSDKLITTPIVRNMRAQTCD